MRKSIFLFLLSLFFSASALSITPEDIHQLIHHPGDPVVGNSRGNVTVIEFFDYQCSHCVNMADILANIVRENPSVRIVYKEYPIRGDLSLTAARAALAANKQGKYGAFQHALLTSEEPFSESLIFQIAKRTGLNVAQLKKEMQGATVARIINNNLSLGEALGVNGTPAFFIAPTNGATPETVQFVLGEMSQREIENAVKEAQSR
ncbi:MAG TPA: thioredoxin domain-containing protein [Gammaproteobacteria bacterium]|jgi:protein-disulfide isomerase|nr:thioredoxin domain-containing protein [Gammaproteobacteria bacterium]